MFGVSTGQRSPLPHRNGASWGEFRDGDRGVARIHYCLSCSWECERHEDGSARAREWVDTTYDTWSRIFAVCAGCATLRCARLISSSAVLRMGDRISLDRVRGQERPPGRRVSLTLSGCLQLEPPGQRQDDGEGAGVRTPLGPPNCFC